MNTYHYASPVSEPSLTGQTLTFPFSKKERSRESGQRDSLSHGVKCTVYVPIQSLGTIRDIHVMLLWYMYIHVHEGRALMQAQEAVLFNEAAFMCTYHSFCGAAVEE